MNNAYIMKIKEHQLNPDILWKEKIVADLSLISSYNVSALDKNILCNLTKAANLIDLSDEPEGSRGREGGEGS